MREIGMTFFSKCYIPELFEGQQEPNDRGWVAAVLAPDKLVPGDSLSLSDAWTDNNLSASFIFSSVRPSLANAEDARFLVSLVRNFLSARGISRGIIWLSEDIISGNNSSDPPSFGFKKRTDTEEGEINYALNMSFGKGTGISFIIDNGMLISLDNETLYFKNKEGYTIYNIYFDGPVAPPKIPGNSSTGKLEFSGPERGCIAFDVQIASTFLHDKWFWGFQFQVPNPNKGSDNSFLTEWIPFAEPSLLNDGADLISFSCVFDPSDVFNRTLPYMLDSQKLRLEERFRTLLKFTDKSLTNAGSKGLKEQQQISLKSHYRTTTGAGVTLCPICVEQVTLSESDMVAALAFAQGTNLGISNLYVTPLGDFVVSAPIAPSSKRSQIMCGLQGNEYISLEPVSEEYEGDRLRFIGSQPSYGYCYPLLQASPVGPPVDLTDQMLKDTFITSWVTVVSAQDDSQKPVYVAQPKGAPLYGQDQVINPKYKNLLGSMHPGTELSEAVSCFPMIPYAGVSPGDGQRNFDSSLIGLFERQFLSPIRRAKIGTGKSVPSALGHQPLIIDSVNGFNITTPSGWLVTINDNGEWAKILLAQLTQPEETQLSFQLSSPELKQAFQTADPMLVIANSNFLGKMSSDQVIKDTESTFNNKLNIENWVLTVQVGKNCHYGDYANVIIVKGVKGKLFDPTYDPKTSSSPNPSLVANPAKWTQKEDFAAPNGKMDELVPLSKWLLDYFSNAAEKTSSDTESLYFEKFNKIVQDENWTGILILHANIAELPEQLKGAVIGINDRTQFYAHHLAIETGQIVLNENGIELKDSTSVYGLIYYSDPAYDSKSEQPVASNTGSDYDFRLLTLKVLFENSSIKNFQSYAQLTLNKLFGSQVTAMGEGGNIYNSIILCGTLHEHDGAPVYGLGSLKDHTYTFLVDNNVFNKIEITSAQMNTRQATADCTKIWFGLTGYLDFATLRTGPESDPNSLNIDLLSFGSTDGKTPRSGLHFSNLGLAMSYSDPKIPKFEFNTDEIRFDLDSSTTRENSLYRSFALELEDLTRGDVDNTPSEKGFLKIITENLRLSGVDQETWYGLKFRLNLGTPGELAGKVGLNANLLLAWSTLGGKDNDYKVEAGLHMPGASNGANLISLQNVLNLFFGSIKLIYAKEKAPSQKRRFMLQLNDIALKFLGLMKIPPNGATMFYLFGNPASEGEANGLGWYAMYRKDKDKTDTVTTNLIGGNYGL
jgi:hypothetical protein